MGARQDVPTRIDLTIADLEQAPGKLTDSVLDIDARAGFQGVLSGPRQTSFTSAVAGSHTGAFTTFPTTSAPRTLPNLGAKILRYR
jgi:hypothetical protein